MLPPQLHQRLETIATFHKAMAALVAAFSSIFLIHVAIGIIALINPDVFTEPGGQPQPLFFGLMFLMMGSAAVLIGWTFAALVWRTSGLLRQRRSWTFCVVVDAILCTFAPLGTVLGVFGLLALMDPQVKAEFGVAAAGVPLPPAADPQFVPGAERPGALPQG